jgi:hypothetical protein
MNIPRPALPSGRHFNFNEVPLLNSPPLLFQFRQTASLLAGSYEFVPGRLEFTPSRPINPGTLYWFRTLSSFADITEEDYRSAITTMPVFTAYEQQEAGASFFREGVQLGAFFNAIPFEFAKISTRSGNKMLGNITGELTQTAGLLGKTSITITVVLAVQEIADRAFAQNLMKGFRG